MKFINNSSNNILALFSSSSTQITQAGGYEEAQRQQAFHATFCENATEICFDNSEYGQNQRLIQKIILRRLGDKHGVCELSPSDPQVLKVQIANLREITDRSSAWDSIQASNLEKKAKFVEFLLASKDEDALMQNLKNEIANKSGDFKLAASEWTDYHREMANIKNAIKEDIAIDAIIKIREEQSAVWAENFMKKEASTLAKLSVIGVLPNFIGNIFSKPEKFENKKNSITAFENL